MAEVRTPLANVTGFTASPVSSTDGNYTLSWNPVPGASSYVLAEHIDYGGNPTFSAPTTTSQAFTNRESGTYLYAIKACDIWNACSAAYIPLGSYLSVTVTRATAPATPTNLTGPTTRVFVPPYYTIGWSAVPGATRYVVEENPTCRSGPNNQVVTAFQEVTQNSFPGPLTACRTGGNQGFRYRVKACSGAMCSAWSEFRDVDVYITDVQRLPAGPLVAKRIYLHTDALGSPVAETNTATPPQVIKRRYYEPYGASPSEDYPNGPGFTGHVTDENTRLTYMQQRYYDPIAARFLSMDPVTTSQENGGNFNRYWYANGNPYKFTDPDGRFSSMKDHPAFKDSVRTMQISAQANLSKAAVNKEVAKQVKDTASGAIKEVEKRTSVGVDVGAANGIGAKGSLSKNLAGDVKAKGSSVIGEGLMIGAFATYDVLSFEVPTYKESAFSIESAELNVAFIAGIKIRLEADVAGRMVLSAGPSGGFGALVHTTPKTLVPLSIQHTWPAN